MNNNTPFIVDFSSVSTHREEPYYGNITGAKRFGRKMARKYKVSILIMRGGWAISYLENENSKWEDTM